MYLADYRLVVPIEGTENSLLDILAQNFLIYWFEIGCEGSR